MKPGITVQCVGCKAKKTLSLDEARDRQDVPFCDKCGTPMVVHSANVKARRKGVDLRDVMSKLGS